MVVSTNRELDGVAGVIATYSVFSLARSGHLATCLCLGAFVVLIGGQSAASVAMVLAFFQIVLGTFSGFILNDLIDLSSDKIDKPHRPIAAGVLHANTALSAIIGCQVAAWAMAVLITVIVPEGVLLLAYGVVGTAYPLLKGRLGAFKGFFVSSAILFPLLFGAILGDRSLPRVLPSVAALLIYIVHRELLMDIHDVRGDAAVGARTIATLHGTAAATRIAGFLWGLAVSLLAVAQLRGSWAVPALIFIWFSGLQFCLFSRALNSDWRGFVAMQWVPMLACASLLL